MNKKLFLLPGITGIVLLMLFCYYILSQKPVRIRSVDVLLFTGRLEKSYNEVYNKPFRVLRNYEEIHFTGTADKDQIKLAYARIRMTEIIQHRDSIHGIHFSFEDSCRFDIFIHSLDILRQVRAQRYIVDNAEIWFLEQPEPPEPIEHIPFPRM